MVARLPLSRTGAPLPAPVAALQWALVAVAVLGGLPLLTFDLAPDPSSAAITVLTASICPLVVIGASTGQLNVLRRIPRDTERADSSMSAAVASHARASRIGAALIAAACATSTAGFLTEELHRVGTGHAGDYGTVPFVLLVAVTAAGLPHSWTAGAVSSLILLAHLAAGLGPAPAPLDAAAIIAVSLPAAVNALRASRPPTRHSAAGYGATMTTPARDDLGPSSTDDCRAEPTHLPLRRSISRVAAGVGTSARLM
jgi:hypothetical protein